MDIGRGYVIGWRSVATSIGFVEWRTDRPDRALRLVIGVGVANICSILLFCRQGEAAELYYCFRVDCNDLVL
jgi:hypothetical protein